MDTALNDYLDQWISEKEQSAFATKNWSRALGGDINEAFRLEGSSRAYFVKLNQYSKHLLFKAEAASLREMQATRTLRVPRVVGFGEFGRNSFLVLEALDFGPPAKNGWCQMAEQLATLHRCTSESFGWSTNNFIGSSVQYNSWTPSWAQFFRNQRLAPQFALAEHNGIQLANTSPLLDAVESLLTGHNPAPSLLHGDLWSGNASFLADGGPVFFDPAAYYGDRETDLAFNRLFKGFPPEFYAAYTLAWPMEDGHEVRAKLYNLYHIINHANLFGGSYIQSAEKTIREILAI